MDSEIVHTPLDKAKRKPRESLRRGNDAPPRPPALWASCDVFGIGVPEPCLGRYPRGFVRWAVREAGLAGRAWLHVCSGALSRSESCGGWRVDVRAAAAPDVRADGRRLPFQSGSVDGVLLDPPYSVEYAQDLYGTDYPRPSHLLAEAARVCRGGGRIGMLHYLVCVPPPDCRLVRVHGVTTGLGYRIRAWTLYEKGQRGLIDAS